jgi:hypothetical protein
VEEIGVITSLKRTKRGYTAGYKLNRQVSNLSFLVGSVHVFAPGYTFTVVAVRTNLLPPYKANSTLALDCAIIGIPPRALKADVVPGV